ncbi:MAG: hypothetical protein WCG98_02195 [bacterium]
MKEQFQVTDDYFETVTQEYVEINLLTPEQRDIVLDTLAKNESPEGTPEHRQTAANIMKSFIDAKERDLLHNLLRQQQKYPD